MAPARSIQCISRPPSREFKGLASFGSTISAISEIDSRTGRGRINFALSSSFINCHSRAIGLQIAVRESEHARVRMQVEPTFVYQIKRQFPMLDGSVV